MSKKPLFTVTNHHTAAMGTAPQITDETGTYRSYFESGLGDQWVFVYDRASQQGLLYCGDYDWEKPAVVQDGAAVALVLNEAERFWLASCWAAATGMRIAEVLARQQQLSEAYARRIEEHLREMHAESPEMDDLEQTSRELERRLQADKQ